MMATQAASSESRSHRGCWTCRLRKKKCDENRPACSICVGLELECHGYGDKPTWMDSGPLQRDQALRIKRIVGRTNSKRRRQQTVQSSAPLPDTGADMDVIYKEASGSSDGPTGYNFDEIPLIASGWQMEGLEKEDQFDTWNLDLDLFDKEVLDGPFKELPFVADSIPYNHNWESDLAVEGFFSSGHNSVPSTSSRVSEDSRTKSTSTFDLSTARNSSEVCPYSNCPDGINLRANNVSTTEWPWSNHLIDMQSLSERPMVPEYADESILRGELEDKLFMHYMDEVFYIQYPFYKTALSQSRSWLFSSLRRARSVYHVTLALSERHIQLTAERALLPTLFNKMNYYNMAIQEMEHTMGLAGIDHGMDRITCVLQALWYELFAGSNGNWRSHLLTAATLISPHVQARMKSTRPGSAILDCYPRQPQERDVSYRDDTGTRVIFGTFIWFDIMACASTRSQPSLGLDHRCILEIFGIDLGSLFGCTNQIMVLIFETALLDNWKKEAEQSRQLSMVELVNRGAKIEERLRQAINNSQFAHSPAGSSLDQSSESTLLASRNEITNIFALSALTYLHVVVSGAQPELPEIAESVSKTIDAFRCLSDPKLLRNLVWPFCIAGCLALEEQQGFFRAIFAQAEIASPALGTCAQAFKIIEQCWKMRKSYPHDYCWVSMMDKLNSSILLI